MGRSINIAPKEYKMDIYGPEYVWVAGWYDAYEGFRPSKCFKTLDGAKDWMNQEIKTYCDDANTEAQFSYRADDTCIRFVNQGIFGVQAYRMEVQK